MEKTVLSILPCRPPSPPERLPRGRGRRSLCAVTQCNSRCVHAKANDTGDGRLDHDKRCSSSSKRERLRVSNSTENKTKQKTHRLRLSVTQRPLYRFCNPPRRVFLAPGLLPPDGNRAGRDSVAFLVGCGFRTEPLFGSLGRERHVYMQHNTRP
ncbi:hypothetical protein LZ30DRAFT_734810 [Colletotrichum cereale]|nr:hypothetical protein LZ30DRAFT_734810 [Colletotrichum cereale]